MTDMDSREIVSLKDISKLLSSNTEFDESQTSLFLKELLKVISDQLIHEETVEIENFGFFQINHIQLAEGEEMENMAVGDILSYYRLDFTPAKTLSDIANKPFANFETIKLNPGVIFDNVMILDDVSGDVLAEESILHTEYKLSIEVEEVVESEIEHVLNNESNGEVSEEDLSIVETPLVSKVNETKSEECDSDETFLNIDDEILEKPSIHPKESTRKRREKAKTLFTVVAAGAIIVIIGSAFFLQKTTKNDLISDVFQDNGNVITEYSDTPDSLVCDTYLVNDSVKDVKVAIDNNLTEQKDTVRKHEIVTMTMGKTLRQIALEKYGNKEFWVYIYLKNKSKIENPNNVPVGVRLTLPFEDEYWIDSRSSKSIRKASEIGIREMSQFEVSS